ncbi:DUF4365 domain-containing protein [Streptomyces sp. NPDC002232]|uniref:DUF4365 domain-containing protein n=1 Tax=Streptomyces sp. NPDC002232 TaxID=3364640 RepID=UPI0036BA7FF6
MGDPETWQQEQISLAYLSAIATQAGATSAQWNVDKDGVDVTLQRDYIDVAFQMKCTFSPTLLADGDTYAFDLDMRTYDILRRQNRSSAGFLGLVVVPRELDGWLEHDDESLLMRCTGYYARIQDAPALSNKETTRIHLPKKQRLDRAGLDEVFTYAFDRLFKSGTGEGAS